MNSIAILTDSNSGITQQQAQELGVHVIPMPFMIGEDTYFEGITLEQDAFYKMLEQDVNISTSQPSPESVMNTWNELLKDYEKIIHIPMSSGLSSTCETAMMLAHEYDGRVLVVNNQRISVSQRQSVLDAICMRDQGMSAEEIYNRLEDTKYESSIYIMLDTLKYLKKGGRITPAAAALGTLLRLKPVLQIQGEKLDAFAKARTLKQAKQIMLNAAKNDIENRFGDPNHENKVWISVAHTENLKEAERFKQEILEMFPGYDVYIDHLSLSVACHIGPGSLAVCLCKKINE